MVPTVPVRPAHSPHAAPQRTHPRPATEAESEAQTRPPTPQHREPRRGGGLPPNTTPLRTAGEVAAQLAGIRENVAGGLLMVSTCRCGVMFEGTARKLHCSARCQRDASLARRRASSSAECGRCGATIARGAPGRWCSAACAPFEGTRVCALDGCGIVFRPSRAIDTCCSELHGKAQYNRMSRADGRQSNPPWDDRRRANWKRRYALTRGAEDAETFDYLEVFERDDWVCGICDQAVDSDRSWPDPMSPSLDHIIPVARGGSHTRENGQLAHLRCNTRKSDSVELVA